MALCAGMGSALNVYSEKLKEERDREEWECRKIFPTERKKAPDLRLERKEKVYLGSPLRRELESKDVEEVSHTSWTEALKQLEIGEDEGEHGTFLDFFQDRMGPNIDFNNVDLIEPHISEAETNESNDSGYWGSNPEDASQHKITCAIVGGHKSTPDDTSGLETNRWLDEELGDGQSLQDGQSESLVYVGIGRSSGDLIAFGPEAKLENVLVW